MSKVLVDATYLLNCIGFAVFFLRLWVRDDTLIETSFCEAISTAKEQKSISLEKRARATYAEYCRQKASGFKRARTCDYRLANIQHCDEGMLSESLVGTYRPCRRCNF